MSLDFTAKDQCKTGYAKNFGCKRIVIDIDIYIQIYKQNWGPELVRKQDFQCISAVAFSRESFKL